MNASPRLPGRPRRPGRPRVRIHARSRAAVEPPARTPRVRPWRPVVVVALIAALVAAGIGLYFDERSSREQPQAVGSATTQDFLELDVVLQRVDATALTLAAKVLVQPHGGLAAPNGPLVPAQDVVVETTSLEQAALKYPANQQISFSTVAFNLTDGRLSDYPFDSYRAPIGFRATVGGRPVPVVLNVQEADPFFVLRRSGQESGDGAVEVTERISRSRSTFILAWFMIIAMWALGLSALVAAFLIVRQRRGLVWPALGWMAATLFALVGMRNAAPGGPPIGSLLDYSAFFWAEALVTASLTMVVVRGVRVEGRHPT